MSVDNLEIYKYKLTLSQDENSTGLEVETGFYPYGRFALFIMFMLLAVVSLFNTKDGNRLVACEKIVDGMDNSLKGLDHMMNKQGKLNQSED